MPPLAGSARRISGIPTPSKRSALQTYLGPNCWMSEYLARRAVGRRATSLSRTIGRPSPPPTMHSSSEPLLYDPARSLRPRLRLWLPLLSERQWKASRAANNIYGDSCYDAQLRLSSGEIWRTSVAYRGGSFRNPLTRLDHRSTDPSIGDGATSGARPPVASAAAAQQRSSPT